MPKSPSNQITKKDRRELKKHVATVHMDAPFGLLERKIGNILLEQAYKHLLANETHEMPVSLLLLRLGWESSKNIDDLRTALSTIVATEVQFNLLRDGKNGVYEHWETTTMMSYASIAEGWVTWRYDRAMAAKLYSPSVYATISLASQQALSSKYSFALYENCVRFKDVPSTGFWTLPVFRQLVGAGASSFDDFKTLAARVINPAVEEINRMTNISVVVSYERRGRRVTGIRFEVTETQQLSLLAVPDEGESLTPEEGALAAELEKRLSASASMARSTVIRLRNDLPRVREVMNHVLVEMAAGRVRKSAAGLFKTLIELETLTPINSLTLAAETASRASIKSMEQAAIKADESATFTKITLEVQQKINALTPAQEIVYANQFVAEVPARGETFNRETGEFADKLMRLGFRVWLKARLAE